MSNYKASVRVEVVDRASQVEVRDSNYQVVAEGFGYLDAELPAGIFKARTQVGSVVKEQLFAIEEGVSPANIFLDPVVFSSPAPLQYTNTHHEYHEAALAEAMGAPIPDALTYGSGARLLLSIRDPSSAPFNQTDESRDTYARAFDGFSLCRSDGSELIDYDQVARRDIGLGFVICNVELDPGHYILKVERVGHKSMALPVITLPGWSSQIFVLVEKSGAITQDVYQPLLKDAAVMMLPLWQQDFQPADHYFRLTEVARQALQSGRNILDRNLMNDLLNSKFGNPILGLFSAHLLLLRAKPKLDLLRVVVDNLAGLLGYDFPDVVVLQHRLRQLDPDGVFAVEVDKSMPFPPLLRASWDIAATMAAESDEFMPVASVSWQVADRLIDNGIWTAWNPRPIQLKSHHHDVVVLSDDELLEKKSRDRERIFTMNDFSENDKYLITGQDLLKVAKQVSKPVVREKLRQFINSVVRNDDHSDDILHELVVRLVKNYSWSDLVKKLAELDVNGEISDRLSSVQKSLIPALLMFRQQLDNGEEITPESLQQLIASLQLPKRLLLENLSELARFVAGLEVHIAAEKIAQYEVSADVAAHDNKKLDEVVRGVTGISLADAKALVMKAALNVRANNNKNN